jgi:hypothetical protein
MIISAVRVGKLKLFVSVCSGSWASANVQGTSVLNTNAYGAWSNHNGKNLSVNIAECVANAISRSEIDIQEKVDLWNGFVADKENVQKNVRHYSCCKNNKDDRVFHDEMYEAIDHPINVTDEFKALLNVSQSELVEKKG